MVLENQGHKKVYSDGREAERRMLEIARNYPEELSEAAIAGNYDYTTNNTFSPVRRNLLNWYSFRRDSSVLEIGAGMGSLTGLLCDRCAEVTALEMNEDRAAVIQARYGKRNNLEIIVDDVNHVTLSKKFDYVIFVGVLEYAALFCDAADPFTEFLRTASSFLNDDGRLLFAIENQYGLKYWCGAAEEHLQQPFVGIAGYEAHRTARTFSRAALERLLCNTGLVHQRFYAALPDYKFPTMLFTDEWKLSGSDLSNIAYTYGKNSLLVADERKLYMELAENGVVSFFANSFFVEAAAVPLEETHPVLVTARGENLPEYRIITTLTSDKMIKKQAACPQAETHLRQIDENEKALEKRGIPILKMQLQDKALIRHLSDLPRADTVFRDCLRQGNLDGVRAMVEALRSALLKSSELIDSTKNALIREGIAAENDDFGPILQNGYLDMTFYNAFLDRNSLIFFDQEWCVPGLPVEFILYYAVKCVYARGAEESFFSQERVLESFGFNLAHQASYDLLESAIWGKLFTRQGDFYGAGGYCTQYHNTNKLSSVTDQFTTLSQEKEKLLSDLQCKNGYIERLLQSERDLSAVVKQKDDAITQNLATIAEKEQIIALQSLMLVEKEQTIALQINTLNEKEQTIAWQSEALAEKEQTIRNKEGHIELLLQSDRELDRIKASRSWRFMGYAWTLRDKLIPKGSKRRLFGKMLVKFVKHPLRFALKCKPHKILKFFKILRREGVESTSRQLDNCLMGTEIPPQELIIEAVPGSVQQAPTKTADDYVPLYVPAWDNPMVSIIIPVYNQFEYTYLCIKSILTNSGAITYEVIVADDCSTDMTQAIDTIIFGLKSVQNPVNLRFLRNCNNAAKLAKGKYILFLNNDTQVQENWLQPLVSLLEADDTVGMTGSKLVYPDGRLQEAGGILWRDGSAWNYGNRSDPDLPEYNYVKEVDYISGASICIRRTLWDEIGGFDERFAPAYAEDSDLAFEVRRHGYKVVYQPQSVVVHFEGISNGTDTSSGQKAYQISNQQKLFEKWHEVFIAQQCNQTSQLFWARDRSKGKKTLLMVDHYVPQYDKDAGSRTVYQYLKLFVGMNFSVKFIGDNFYPHEPYTSNLQQLGVEVLYGSYYVAHWKDWIKRNGQCIDFVFLNRPHISVKYIDYIRMHTDAKIIYYGHDLHFLREQREYAVLKDESLLKSSRKWRKEEIELMRMADLSYYPSQIEVDEIRNIDNHISVKAIPAYLFDTVVKKHYCLTNRNGIMFIGGFMHRPNVDAVKWFVEEILPFIMKKLPNIIIYILGSNPPDSFPALQTENVKICGFVSDEALLEYYKRCRLSIVPLRYGAGIKGKVVEAMANGIPIVTTSVGAEGIDNSGGFLAIADDAQTFAEKIVTLYEDEVVLCEMVENAYTYIEKYFTPEYALSVMGDDFK